MKRDDHDPPYLGGALFEPAADPPDLDRLLPLSLRCEVLARMIEDFETNSADRPPLDLSLLRRTFEHVAAALKIRERFGR